MVVVCCVLGVVASVFFILWLDEMLTHKVTRTTLYRVASKLEVAEAHNEYALTRIAEVMALLHHLESKEFPS